MELSYKEKIFLDTFLKYKNNYDFMKYKLSKYKLYVKSFNLDYEISKIKIKKNNQIIYRDFVPFGILINNYFNWMPGINDVFYDHFKKYNFDEEFASLSLINYLFNNNEIYLQRKYRKIILYIMSFTNAAFKVVEFKGINGNILFGLIRLNVSENKELNSKFMDKIKIFIQPS
jgi:hypothetical protein